VDNCFPKAPKNQGICCPDEILHTNVLEILHKLFKEVPQARPMTAKENSRYTGLKDPILSDDIFHDYNIK
jgi:hypothetical protein